MAESSIRHTARERLLFPRERIKALAGIMIWHRKSGAVWGAFLSHRPNCARLAALAFGWLFLRIQPLLLRERTSGPEPVKDFSQLNQPLWPRYIV